MAYTDLASPSKAAKGLASQRQQTEQAVEKLTSSIKYWEGWQQDYEGLREALQSLGADAPGTAIEDVGKRSVGDLLNEKEINILFRDDRSGPRTAPQVIGLLSRRIEYVQSNITSLRNQLQAAKGPPEASSVSSRFQQDDNQDYPLMEIQEELDEDDNVISSSITPASAAAPQVVEALRKAGMNGLPKPQQDKVVPHTIGYDSNVDKSDSDSKTTSPILKQASSGPLKARRDQQPSPSTSESDSKGDDCNAGRRRKSVTFADGTKQPTPTPTEPRSARDAQAAKVANRARRIKAEVRGSIDALKKVHNAGFISDEVFDRFRQEYVERLQLMPSKVSGQRPVSRQAPEGQGEISVGKASTEKFSPVMPTNEPLEDAALRREMIRYNMNEVGAVVAEMNLDDDSLSDPSDTGESNTEDERRHSSDEDEDRWGMNTSGLLSSDYIKQMEALERKLNSKSAPNNESSAGIETLLQAEKDLEIGQDGNPTKKSPGLTSTDREGKAVRFANALDIQERPPSPKAAERKQTRRTAAQPVHADIVERSTPIKTPHSTNITTPKKKASQFKSSLPPERQVATVQHLPPLQMQVSNGNQVKTPSLPAFTPPATPKMRPTGPAGRTHAPNVIERPYSDNSNMESVSEPDNFDPALLQQEVTMDYHRARNRMIQRQGGFLASEEDEEEEEAEGPLVDENGKKISRFKAARIKALGG
ncbi:MAG: hypothetical protein Q9209_001872 [Squamulea sp. 1 TL-2023]